MYFYASEERTTMELKRQDYHRVLLMEMQKRHNKNSLIHSKGNAKSIQFARVRRVICCKQLHNAAKQFEFIHKTATLNIFAFKFSFNFKRFALLVYLIHFYFSETVF